MPDAILRSVLVATLFLATGCASLVSALFGRTVDIDDNDRTPPSVRIVVPDAQISSPMGEFVVMSADATARSVARRITLSVIAEDPEGVRFAALEDIHVTPWCADVPMGRDGRPPPPPQPRPAPAYTIRGSRVDNDGSDGTATTRVPLNRTVAPGLYSDSPHCPADRPRLHGAEVRVRALAGNFGPGPAVHTGEGLIRIGYTGSSGGPGGVIVGGGPSGATCSGEGDACEVQPAECTGRGADFAVSGRIVCRGTRAVCEARHGTDYCASCGGDCGGCAGDSCITDNDCAPPAVCARSVAAGGPNYCRSLRVPEPSTGRVPCPYVAGMCWTASELDDQAVRALICTGR